MPKYRIEVGGKSYAVNANSPDELDAVADEIRLAIADEAASADSDMPTVANLAEAEASAEAQRGPKPGIWERAGAIINAGVTTGGQAAMGALTAPVANAQALANSVTRGDFGTYEGARRTQQEAGERVGRVMPDTSTTARLIGGNPELANQYLDAADPFLASLEAGVPGMAGFGGRVPRSASELRAIPGGDAIANGANRVGNFVEQRAQNRRDAGAAETESLRMHQAEMEKRLYEARLAGLGEDTGLTRGQLARNIDEQAREDMIAHTDEGRPILERYQQQNDRLIDSVDETAADIGMSPDGEYVPYGSYDVGNRAKQVFQREKDAAGEEVDRLYTEARAADEANLPVGNDKVNAYLATEEFDDFRSYTGTDKALPNFERFLVNRGFADIVDGKIVMRELSVGDMEKVRASLDGFKDKGAPQTGRMVRELTEVIDEQLDGVEGGTLFREARAKRRQYAVDFEENMFVDQLLDTKGKYSADKISPETVTRKVYQLPVDELKRVESQLRGFGTEGAQAWRDITSGILRDLAEQVKTTQSNASGEGRGLSVAGLVKKIDDLDQTGKLELLFGEVGAAKLRAIRNTAQVANQKLPGVGNPSGSANKIIRMLGTVGRQAVNVGSATPVLGQSVEFLSNKVRSNSNSKAAAAQLDGEGMLQRAGQ